MKQLIGKFLTRLRQKRFEKRIEREICYLIFPHLNGDADHGYPFKTDVELLKAHYRGYIKTRILLKKIYERGMNMPKAESDAFCYIVTRDINERLQMFLEYSEEHQPATDCNLSPAAAAA